MARTFLFSPALFLLSHKLSRAMNGEKMCVRSAICEVSSKGKKKKKKSRRQNSWEISTRVEKKTFYSIFFLSLFPKKSLKKFLTIKTKKIAAADKIAFSRVIIIFLLCLFSRFTPRFYICISFIWIKKRTFFSFSLESLKAKAPKRKKIDEEERKKDEIKRTRTERIFEGRNFFSVSICIRWRRREKKWSFVVVDDEWHGQNSNFFFLKNALRVRKRAKSVKKKDKSFSLPPPAKSDAKRKKNDNAKNPCKKSQNSASFFLTLWAP